MATLIVPRTFGGTLIIDVNRTSPPPTPTNSVLYVREGQASGLKTRDGRTTTLHTRDGRATLLKTRKS